MADTNAVRQKRARRRRRAHPDALEHLARNCLPLPCWIEALGAGVILQIDPLPGENLWRLTIFQDGRALKTVPLRVAPPAAARRTDARKGHPTRATTQERSSLG